MNKNYTNSNLYLLIGCDCDPDRLNFNKYNQYDDPYNSLYWTGISQGLDINLQRVREKIKKSLDIDLKIILNIRADTQIKSIYGSSYWCIERFIKIWENLKIQGDEIAWHPHLWRYEKNSNIWYQEMNDYEWISECYELGINAFSNILDKPITVHTGWCYHNNYTMKKAGELGIEYDYSALPGMATSRKSRKYSSNIYDWSKASFYPYIPSHQDYQHQSKNADSHIIEVPTTVSNNLFGGYMALLYSLSKKNIKQALYLFTKSYPFFCTITSHPLLFKIIVNDYFKKHINNFPFFITYFHCDELLDAGLKKSYYKIYFDSEYIYENISYLKKQAEIHDKKLIITTFKEQQETLRQFT